MEKFNRKDTEQQAHGFKFEDYIIYKYGLIKDKDRTSPWDAYTSDGIPISIKNSGRGSSDIVFGDFFRQARMEEDKFILMIGFWEGSWQNLTDMYIIPITASDWTSMFNEDVINYYEIMLETMSKRGNNDNKKLWDDMRDNGKPIEEDNKSVMGARCRWGSEKSKKTGLRYHRIQCAINRSDFNKRFIDSGKYNLRYRDLRGLRDEYLRFVERTTKKVKHTKTTHTKITEDTKYGKKVTEITETEVTESEITETEYEYYSRMAEEIEANLDEMIRERDEFIKSKGWR